VPQGSNNLPITIPVATQTLHAVGLGYAIKYRRRDDVVLVFFGMELPPRAISTRR